MSSPKGKVLLGLRSIAFSVTTLILLLFLGLGVFAGVAVSSPPAPEELREGKPVLRVPIEDRRFDDETEVSVSVVTQAGQSLTTTAQGRVTALNCPLRQDLASGTTALAVDGQPIINLFTRVPLWRDLAVGDVGTDAAAVNEELSRLGYPVAGGNRISWTTASSFERLREALGATDDAGGVIALSSILWFPSETITADACPLRVGDAVEPGDTVFSLPATLTSATVASGSVSHAEGGRVLVLGEERIAVSQGGVIVDPAALSRIAQSAEFSEASKEDESGSVRFNAKWKLSQPITVSVVPPSSLFGISGSTGCAVVKGAVVKAKIVGSELGQSFVVFDRPDVSGEGVEVAPDTRAKCE